MVIEEAKDVARNIQVSRILIADKHVLFRQGLRSLFSAEKDFEVTGEASALDEAIDEVKRLEPDVLIIDLALLDEAPERAMSLRQAHSSLGILFLTHEDGPRQLETALSAGARGYMLKSSKSNQFVAAVRKVAEAREGTGCEVSPDSLSDMTADLQALARSSASPSRTTVLTAREMEILKLLAEGQTVREVALLLLLSAKTIEAHKLNLMRKLDIHNRAALIEYAVRQGVVTRAVVS